MRAAFQKSIGYIVAGLAVAAVTAVLHSIIVDVNHTTVALSFLLVVLISASAYGIGPAILASVAGVLCFNYFFIPPVGSFTIDEPQNWVALSAFLVTAVIASKLSSAARSRQQEAERRREEVWRLYQLSRAIIITPDSETAVSSIARQVLEVFDAQFCSVFARRAGGGWQRLAIASAQTERRAFSETEPSETEPSEAEMEQAFATGEIRLAPERAGVSPPSEVLPSRIAEGHGLIYAPLKVGVRPTGVLVLAGPALERGTIEAIAGLVAIALERARFLREVSRTEALRQSDELKSALLASVSHALRTPLTSIRAAVDSLLQHDLNWDQEALGEFHLIISEEVHRLSRLVGNLLEMARIEAGELQISKEWGSVSEIFANVIERCAPSFREHEVIGTASEDLPLVKVDSRLVAEALTNIVENAAKYSPPSSRIALDARVEAGNLIISVIDEGPGIGSEEIGRIFDKFYRGPSTASRPSAGTGMGLAITRGIVEAHGGTVRAESGGEGARFTISIPVESKAVAAVGS